MAAADPRVGGRPPAAVGDADGGAVTLFPDGSVAVVTGASKGIGAACAIDLAREGCSVVVNYNRDETGAKNTVSAIEEFGGKAVAWQADVNDEQAVRKFFLDVRREFKRLDVLVANAGITRDKVMVAMSREDFDSVLMTNVSGTFMCCREAAKLMSLAKKGSIVTLSSITTMGYPAVSNYSASKAAIASYTKSIAAELALMNIRCNTVSPGLIETAMTKKMHPEARKAFVDATALGRGAAPSEVAHVVSFLASEKASYITGADIAVDGGASLGMVVPQSGIASREQDRRRKISSSRKPSRTASRTATGSASRNPLAAANSSGPSHSSHAEGTEA